MTTLDVGRTAPIDGNDEAPGADSSRRLHASAAPLRTVLCGSYRRDPVGLRAALLALREHFEVLAPRSVDFVDVSSDFVRLPEEIGETAGSIERRHLAAISTADFVWLHAPEGYVGPSASLEIGHAHALGIPVFTDATLTDEMLASMTHRVAAAETITLAINENVLPGEGIRSLQRYYERAAVRRGWDQEGARDAMLLITEEIGELARAVRKSEGLSRAGGYAGVDDVALELADVQLYLVHLANTLGVDLAAAVSQKERINDERTRLRATA